MVFLEEDHYVAEDFLYILELMQQKSNELCQKCNILSLGTYLKTFNYYTYNKKVSLHLFPQIILEIILSDEKIKRKRKKGFTIYNFNHPLWKSNNFWHLSKGAN